MKLSNRVRRLEFETAGRVQGRPVMVEATPHAAVVRLKGTRAAFTVAWESVYFQGAKRAADWNLDKQRG